MYLYSAVGDKSIRRVIKYKQTTGQHSEHPHTLDVVDAIKKSVVLLCVAGLYPITCKLDLQVKND